MNRAPHEFAELYELAHSFCEGDLTAAQAARIEDLVLGDDEMRHRYILYMHVHASAEKYGSTLEANTGRAEASGGEFSTPAPAQTASSPVVGETSLPEESPLAPPIVLDLGPVAEPSRGWFAPGGFLFSYGVSAAVVFVGLLLGWMSHFSHDGQLASEPSHRPSVSPSREAEPAMYFVGRITGMNDCHWADTATEATDGAYVPLGRSYALASGLMEITYDTGAKIVLQGPCAFEVDARDGGYLSLGKLTAKVEKKAADGQGVAASEAAAKNHSTLFAVRTPTAIVTDLGTEFGVEVDRSGGTRTYVFRGKVRLQASEAGEVFGQAVPLEENQSGQVEAGGRRSIIVTRGALPTLQFARQLPKRVRIPLFNTGVALREGERDPHWQVVAVSGEPSFQAMSAVVSNVTLGKWLSNEPSNSQWISVVGDLKYVRNFATYTFRTTFALPDDVAPNTAILRGRFLVDNHVTAIRLNGQPVEVPEHSYVAFFNWREFRATSGFIAGNNVLEIDVFNGPDPENSQKIGRNMVSPMLLRVELDGVVRKQAKEAESSRIEPDEHRR